MNLQLERLRSRSNKVATIGELYDELGRPLCYILEPPWLDNHIGMSCIPDGTYKVVPHVSPKFGPCFLLEGTYPREYILIHPGNFPQDTEGCLIPGLRMFSSGVGVAASRKAVTMLQARYPHGFDLTIRWSEA